MNLRFSAIPILPKLHRLIKEAAESLQAFGAQPDPQLAPYWRSLYYFNLYRLTVAGVFVATSALSGATIFGATNPVLFHWVSAIYVLFSLALIPAISFRWPRFDLQLGIQTGADIVFLILLMYSSGGIRSGLGLLLVVALTAASLASQGRLALFYAALASIGVLVEQGYEIVADGNPADYFQAGLLSMVFFATAGLGHFLARRLVASERLAKQKSVDLENLAQVNQLVIQEMQDGVLVVDGKGRLRQHNAQAEKLLGRSPASWGELRLNDYAPNLAQWLERWCDDPAVNPPPLFAEESGKQVRVRFSPVGADPALGAVIFLEDLSRLQTQAQQMKLAALGRLTANIAHEIRNPLSAISHATQLLQEEEWDATEERLLQIIGDNIRRLDRMVQDVLQLNRRDRAQPETIKPEIFLRGFVEQFCQSENIPTSAVSLEIDTDRPICFDRAHLYQVLWNLCRNAWRHGRKQDASLRLCVSDAHIESVVQLDVIDDGPGVDKALQSQLFEPFFTTFSSGTGLGLYIAREVCEANGASLDYVEVAPGGQFRICCKGAPC